MISVCIATHNGSRFLREQLDSILSQLGPSDEVIVCDDQSEDATLAIIESYRDTRIRVFRNEVRLRHVKNFERAMTLSRGEFIFLSDQDDIWPPGRVSDMIERIEANPRTLLVASNFDLIDESGRDSGEFRSLGSVGSSRIIQLAKIFAGKAPYFGCTFLMRREIFDYCLPIPARIEAHDIWIALIASFLGRAENITGSTLLHRIHGANLTSSRRPLPAILKSRYFYISALINRAFRLIFNLRKATSK